MINLARINLGKCQNINREKGRERKDGRGEKLRVKCPGTAVWSKMDKIYNTHMLISINVYSELDHPCL